MRMENLFEGVKVLGEFSSSRKALNFDLKLSVAYFNTLNCLFASCSQTIISILN